MPERVLERALLGRDLRADVQVLHLAAAADAEVRAARHARAASCRAAAASASPAPSCSCAGAPATCTSSPGSASSMKTTLPSALWATPCASRSSDSTFNHSSGCVMGCDYSCRSTRPVAARALHWLAARRELPREAAEGAGPVATRGRTLRQKDWQALHPSVPRWREARFERVHRRGKRKPATAPPISQVKRTERACSGAASARRSATQPLESHADVRRPPC